MLSAVQTVRSLLVGYKWILMTCYGYWPAHSSKPPLYSSAHYETLLHARGNRTNDLLPRNCGYDSICSVGMIHFILWVWFDHILWLWCTLLHYSLSTGQYTVLPEGEGEGKVLCPAGMIHYSLWVWFTVLCGYVTVIIYGVCSVSLSTVVFAFSNLTW